LHTLQALDAALAGASLREIAEGLFGADAVAADWHADGDLRARVRRLVRRGDALMRGGYRRLAQLAPLEKGRFAADAKRP
ncbi:DNA -binding domain-containing protein, partial [Cronobacter sakazakii]